MSFRSLFHLSLGVVLLVLVAALAPTAGASAPATPGAVAWTGEYYNNTNLSGAPALVRDDPTLNFYWPANTSPAPGWINTSNYAVRWTRSVYFGTTGNWTFSTVNDDGMRVWVDDQITMDAWYDQGPTAHAGTIYLTAGWHIVRVEYYNRANGGTATVTYAIQGNYPNWKGEYYSNQALSGSPALTRNDAAINFSWGTGSPDPSLPIDHFSVRWTQTVYAAAGTYRLTATTDDGMRVWVDGTVMINAWYDQPPTTYTRDVALAAGNHNVKVEYYESGGGATAQFSYAPVSNPTGIWHGQYFSNRYLSGSPALIRDDAAINFNWGAGSPAAGFPSDNFSIKWDATLNLPSNGNYTVTATSDDGVRVWVDGNLLIDGWWDHAPTTFNVTPYLGAGAHNVHVEYYEATGGAQVQVQIAAVNTPPAGGDVIVDDLGAGWQAGGCASCWRGSASGYGNHSFWTWNNTYTLPGYNWARWYPNLSHAGAYEVFAYIPGGLGNTAGARYWIKHAGSYNLALRNQGLYANQWVSLGTYYFADTSDENVSLTDITYECYLCRTIVFDAMKFSPR
ncbi:MAG: PA14 domain-containing protein [Anaerolineae bacterium]